MQFAFRFSCGWMLWVSTWERINTKVCQFRLKSRIVNTYIHNYTLSIIWIPCKVWQLADRVCPPVLVLPVLEESVWLSTGGGVLQMKIWQNNRKGQIITNTCIPVIQKWYPPFLRRNRLLCKSASLFNQSSQPSSPPVLCRGSHHHKSLTAFI